VVSSPSLSTRSIKNTGHRIKYANFDAETGEEVSNHDITRGYKVDTDIRDNWLSNSLLRIVGASTAPASRAPMCRWGSRPQHRFRKWDRYY
jgi:hypothetical protein